ncbi:hypothetical protein F4779DRAFT_293345 [Xylariaceae sp. FL0662B]|nr:hypothetical protein F4779DRAFT_293345 [Xylariaceae sp. FL0662B]
MDPGTEQPPPPQASSHFTLEPVSGATLYELEVARRERLRQRGFLKTGCREIDESVLLGGFERGTVVGVSAEEVDFGLLVGLQTVAHAIVFDSTATSPSSGPRAAIVTTLAATAILPMLRDITRSQVQAKLGSTHQDIDAQVRCCLERISISRVFDIEGLWEVISELETPPSPTPDSQILRAEQPSSAEEPPESSQKSPPPQSPSPPASPPARLPPLRMRTEVLDSEDEGFSSSSPSPPPPLSPQAPPHPPPSSPPQAQPAQIFPTSRSTEKEETGLRSSHIPDIILITHFSTLLTALFTRRDKPTAHTTLQLLSTHLRHLARSSATGGPLILLLNSTTPPHVPTPPPPPPTSSPSSLFTAAVPDPEDLATAPPTNRPLEPTLRSVFNPAPPNPGMAGAGEHYAYAHALSRRNKPAFGVSFAQFLDLHVLCTRQPRGRADAELAARSGSGSAAAGIRYCWVVEVLLDELGVWEGIIGGDGSGDGGQDRAAGGKTMMMMMIPRRRSREQRWDAVDVRAGTRIVDAFEGKGFS